MGVTSDGGEQLVTQNLSETVRDAIIRQIANGDLKPGERLNEVRLAQRFGVSRGPVREAARELEGMGFLISRPRLGFYVATFTPRQIVDLYEVKHWIDRALVHDVMTYLDRDTVLAIRADVDSIDRRSKRPFAETLYAFRVRMVGRLHNRFLADQALALYRKFYLVTALIHVTDEQARITRIISALHRIWDALAEGRAEDAIAVLDEDGRHWREDVAPRFRTDP